MAWMGGWRWAIARNSGCCFSHRMANRPSPLARTASPASGNCTTTQHGARTHESDKQTPCWGSIHVREEARPYGENVGKGEEDVPLRKEPVAHEVSREVVREAQQVERLDYLANFFGHLSIKHAPRHARRNE